MSTTEFPHLDPAALHGLAGEFVRLVGPHTEADPVALLTQLLVMFGNATGRGPHARAEADTHHTNLFVTLVGVTGPQSERFIVWPDSRSPRCRRSRMDEQQNPIRALERRGLDLECA
jgi:hypothetical protein